MGETEWTTPVTQVFSGRCLESGQMHCEYASGIFLLLLNDSIRKSFSRLPTTIEWGRFRKYTRRIRELREDVTPDILSLEVLSALQLRTISEPLLPNLKTLEFWGVHQLFIPFAPLFLSPRVTSIVLGFRSDVPKAMTASVVTTIPTLCPDLQAISLHYLPRDPMITTAIAEMVLATNQNTLQKFRVISPLAEEAGEVVCKLPNLRNLSVVIERETSLPPASLPNLTNLEITCDNEGGWPRLFHGATFRKLDSVTFHLISNKIGDFLGAFERVALSSSVQNTLSTSLVYPSCSWNPNYSSLLPFTQLVDLIIGFSCNGGCSSGVDDDIVVSLSQAMPKLTILHLGYSPCGEFTTGVTAKGLMALALHCPNLSSICIHFQVASLSVPPVSPGINHNTKCTGSWTDCALTSLEVGKMRVPESVSTVALTLLQIFPRVERGYSDDEGWKRVWDAIHISRRIVDCLSGHHSLTIP